MKLLIQFSRASHNVSIKKNSMRLKLLDPRVVGQMFAYKHARLCTRDERINQLTDVRIKTTLLLPDSNTRRSLEILRAARALRNTVPVISVSHVGDARSARDSHGEILATATAKESRQEKNWPDKRIVCKPRFVNK